MTVVERPQRSTRAEQITGPSRQATAEIIARFAATGRDDPSIAMRLGITVPQVRGIRRQFGIPAGETRWFHTGVRTAGDVQ